MSDYRSATGGGTDALVTSARAVAIALSTFSCSGNHDLLTQKPPSPDSTPVVDAAGSIDRSVADSGPPRPDVSASDADGAISDGPWVLTWVNGLVDEPAAQFCFVPVVDGGEAPAASSLLPASGALNFGAHIVLPALPAIDPATVGIHPYAVIGADAGATCSGLVAGSGSPDTGATGARTVSLPIIPAGTLADQASYLAVATGCTVDPLFALDAGKDVVCGSGMGRPAGPDIVLVRLSRRSMSLSVGFEAVHASRATAPAQVDLTDALTGSLLASLGPVSLGQIAPGGQPRFVSQFSLTRDPMVFAVRVSGNAVNSAAPVTSSLASVFALSGLPNSMWWNTSGLTLIVLGAAPGPDAGGNALQVAAVENAPSLTHDP
jgi:hypothetical protein